MKMILAVAGLVIALAAPVYAQGMTAGSEASGEPLNSGVHASARNPDTGYTPGGARSHAKGKAAHAKAYSKKKKHTPMAPPSGTPSGGASGSSGSSGSSGY